MLFSLGNEISLKVTEFFYTDKETGYRQKEYTKKKEIIEAIRNFLNNTDTMKNTFGSYDYRIIQSVLEDYFTKYYQMMVVDNLNLGKFNNYFINFYYLYLWINYLRCIKFKQKTIIPVKLNNIKIADKLKESIVSYLKERNTYKHPNENDCYTPLLLSECEKHNYQKMYSEKPQENGVLVYTIEEDVMKTAINAIDARIKEKEDMYGEDFGKILKEDPYNNPNNLYLYQTETDMNNNYFEKEKENFENFKECSTNLSKSTEKNSECLDKNSKIENTSQLPFMENSFYKLFLFYNGNGSTIRDNNRFCKDKCVLPPEFFIDIPQIFELAFYDSDDEVQIKKEEMQIDVKITEKNKKLEVNFKPITDASSNILLLRRTFEGKDLEPVKEIVINSKNTDQSKKEGVKMIFNLQKEFQEFQKKKGLIFNRGGKKKNKVKRKTIKNNRKQSKKKINNNNNNSRKVKKKKN